MCIYINNVIMCNNVYIHILTNMQSCMWNVWLGGQTESPKSRGDQSCIILYKMY